MTANGTIEQVIDDFAVLDDWEERYRYIIDLGKELEPLPPSDHNDKTKVRGCVSQVWLVSKVVPGTPPRLALKGDSDAHIVRGLIALLFRLYDGKPAAEIVATDARQVFRKLGLEEHLSPQRSNGFVSMVKRVQADAEAALARA